MQPIFHLALSPYTRQKNTGNFYEINVAICLLRRMGLTNDDLDLDTNKTILDTIIKKNVKKQDELTKLFTDIRTVNVGKGLLFDNHPITSIESITQDDTWDTGDLILTSADESTYTVSIFQGTIKQNKTIEKCLVNPTCRHFKCTEEDIKEFEAIGLAAVKPYKEIMTEKYGSDESVWPSRVKECQSIAIKACSEVASRVVKRFDTLTDDEKQEIFRKLIQIHNSKPPADYLAVVNKKTNAIQYFKFDYMPDLTTWTPRLVAKGIWIEFYNGTTQIGKTQVKFNNGVYHKGKTSSICSSWNGTFNLTEIFKMKPVKITEVQARDVQHIE